MKNLRPSPWKHVPLTKLFQAMGNRVRQRRDGTWDSGHEPVHGSKSGRCVWINPETGRYYCRHCHESGDAVTLLMRVKGLSYRDAVRLLEAKFGPPADSRRERMRRGGPEK
jgi:DNA primase